MPPVSDAVETALASLPSTTPATEVARALAKLMDAEPSGTTAKALLDTLDRALADAPVATTDAVDQIAARRDARKVIGFGA